MTYTPPPEPTPKPIKPSGVYVSLYAYSKIKECLLKGYTIVDFRPPTFGDVFITADTLDICPEGRLHQ